MGVCACGCGLSTKRVFHVGHAYKGKVRVPVAARYRQFANGGARPELLHRIRAERALGHKLPKGSIVHHVDGSKGDDSPLVICQDVAYHKMLHYRMKVKEAGGNPNADKLCSRCHRPRPYSEFAKSHHQVLGLHVYCRPCASDYVKQKRSEVSLGIF